MRGAVRIGDYVLDRELPSDCDEARYEAHHVVLPRRVHLRVASAGGQPGALQMLREAWLLEALAHPNMPRLYECGVLPGEQPWLALEPLDGDTVASALADGPLAIAQVVALVRGVAEVLAQAHARGIVHRRVRAEAIVLREAGAPCLVDWRDARVDCPYGSGDVLALGIVAYRALTGRLPAGRAKGPAPLVALIESMLAPDPSRRPSAVTIACEAARLAAPRALADEEPEPPPVVEEIVLDASQITPTETVRVRWTPPNGLSPMSLPPGVPGGKLTRRS